MRHYYLILLTNIHVMRAPLFLALLLSVALAGLDDFDSSVAVTYASVVRLVSPSSGLLYPISYLVSTATTSSSDGAE